MVMIRSSNLTILGYSSFSSWKARYLSQKTWGIKSKPTAFAPRSNNLQTPRRWVQHVLVHLVTKVTNKCPRTIAEKRIKWKKRKSGITPIESHFDYRMLVLWIDNGLSNLVAASITLASESMGALPDMNCVPTDGVKANNDQGRNGILSTQEHFYGMQIPGQNKFSLALASRHITSYIQSDRRHPSTSCIGGCISSSFE